MPVRAPAWTAPTFADQAAMAAAISAAGWAGPPAQGAWGRAASYLPGAQAPIYLQHPAAMPGMQVQSLAGGDTLATR
jgi:hypothetical protein